MASRLYLSSTQAAPISPAFNAGWTVTTSSERRLLRRHPPASGEAAGSTDRTFTTGDIRLDRQFVSQPLNAQTITGTFSGQVRCREGLAAQNVFLRMILYVVSADGSVVRGVLLALADYGIPTEIVAGTARNHVIANVGTAVTNVNAQFGDRIVFELGYTDAAGVAPRAIVHYQAVVTDADYDAGNETDTGVKNPWIEFSQDLSFVPYRASLNRSLEAGFVHQETYTQKFFPVAPNRSLEAGLVMLMTGPYVVNPTPAASPCTNPSAVVIGFDVRTLLPRTVSLANTTVTVQLGATTPETAYSAGAFQAGYSGSVTDTSTTLENRRTFAFTRTALLTEGIFVTVVITSQDDLAVAMAPPFSFVFLTCIIPPAPTPDTPLYRPLTDTLRGGADLFALVPGIDIATTEEDQTFAGLRALPTDWLLSGANGVATFAARGLELSVPAIAGSAAVLTRDVLYPDFDAAVTVLPIVPEAVRGELRLAGAPLVVQAARLRFTTSAGDTASLTLLREGTALRVIGEIVAYGRSLNAGARVVDVPAEGLQLQIVRNEARVWLFVAGETLGDTDAFGADTGNITFDVGNLSRRIPVRTRFSDYRVESHVRLGSRLLEAKSIRFDAILGTVPAAPLDEVGPVDVQVFGLFGTATTEDGFIYTLPPLRTVGVDRAHTLQTVQDVAVKDEETEA